jgi:hypothetical protein
MKMKLAITASGFFLGMSLWIAPSFAEETTSPQIEKAQQSAAVAPQKQHPSNNPILETTIGNYVKAWQKRDFKTMRGYENWEGGAPLGESEYIQTFDSNFRIYDWKITQMKSVGEDEYRVLVLVSHNLPTQIAALMPKRKTVNSTLIQWWKKLGDKYVHLFYTVHKKEFMQLRTQPLPIPSDKNTKQSTSEAVSE